MLIYIMRHGIALPAGGAIYADAQRPLSPAGEKQVRAATEGLKRRSARADGVISSPLRRAEETARIAAEVLGTGNVHTSPILAPTVALTRLRSLLVSYRSESSLLLVGHHPDVTLCVAFLSGRDISVCPVFGTASVAALKLEPGQKKAEFLWFQTSEQLSQP